MNRAGRSYEQGASFSGSARISTIGKNKLRDARLDWLKEAARQLEERPYDGELQTALMGAARAWAKAERDALDPQARRALERDRQAAASLEERLMAPERGEPERGGRRSVE